MNAETFRAAMRVAASERRLVELKRNKIPQELIDKEEEFLARAVEILEDLDLEGDVLPIARRYKAAEDKRSEALGETILGRFQMAVMTARSVARGGHEDDFAAAADFFDADDDVARGVWMEFCRALLRRDAETLLDCLGTLLAFARADLVGHNLPPPPSTILTQ